MVTQNQKQERLPQAPRAPLLELAEFLAPLRGHFTQGPSADTLRQSLTGLLSEQPHKNCDTLAAVVPETTQQQFHPWLTAMGWDETALNRQRIARLLTRPSAGAGGHIFAETGFEKQGRHSVGVVRQYTGTAGKLTHCQVTVNGHEAERTLAWPVATRLYLPQEGAEAAARRTPAHVPTALAFQTTAESARALLDEAKACRVRHACVTGDADYGDNPHFVKDLEEGGERYVVAVRANCSVTLGRGQDSPLLRAEAALAAYPLQVWPTSAWSAGAKGWWRAKCLALRCWRSDGDGTRPVGWLIGQRPARGQHGDWQYCWRNFPANPPLAVLGE